MILHWMCHFLAVSGVCLGIDLSVQEITAKSESETVAFTVFTNIDDESSLLSTLSISPSLESSLSSLQYTSESSFFSQIFTISPTTINNRCNITTHDSQSSLLVSTDTPINTIISESPLNSDISISKSITKVASKLPSEPDQTPSLEPLPQMNDDYSFDNATTVPNFQSFEEWKKNKLNQGKDKGNSNILYNNNNSDSNSNKNTKPINNSAKNVSSKVDSSGQIQEISNQGSGISTTVSDSNDIMHVKRDAIHHQRIKTRDDGTSSNIDKNTANNNVNAPLGDDMVIEISMFSGSTDDQGKLYKDRFNYASFDCAATIVKTNKEAKGANAILLDNKDTYLLNECSASSNFIIIELCEDILIDEVLIGNFEFYSSMFKDLKVSASDRFPTTQWVVLGDFQAENIRQLQTFRIENPLIWSKFLKIEFLSHYGNEFYCPISSVQVHGTTMIEQFKDENPDTDEPEVHIIAKKEDEKLISNENDTMIEQDTAKIPEFDVKLDNGQFQAGINIEMGEEYEDEDISCSSTYLKLDQFLVDYEKRRHENFDQCSIEEEFYESGHSSNTIEYHEAEETKTTQQQQKHHISSHKLQPQDSIYKNLARRLSLLESNATLSLLYIEEQSKLLSDAFTNLEQQQSVKFQNILTQLNSTIQSQMVTFQKLNTDVYTSFSRLFEYQQQNFDSRTIEITNQINQVSKMISFYKNLTYFALVVIFLLFIYILLTKDLYIDEGYFSDDPTSPISTSPSGSIHNIRDTFQSNNPSRYPSNTSIDTATYTALGINDEYHQPMGSPSIPCYAIHNNTHSRATSINSTESDKSSINTTTMTPIEQTTTPTTNSPISNQPSNNLHFHNYHNNNNNSNTTINQSSSPLLSNLTLQRKPIVLRRRSALLENLQKSWKKSRSPKLRNYYNNGLMMTMANTTPESSTPSSPDMEHHGWIRNGNMGEIGSSNLDGASKGVSSETRDRRDAAEEEDSDYVYEAEMGADEAEDDGDVADDTFG